ncbi:hypothetical protein SCP_0203560 [Sparassis crispa]|uniref:F-box domain-containing protein n=1 Tax=Sparassis crispa TaxID=139825 RepID=A0A401GAI0_9APHY|nr:hypothetical protein SCP_0203560 [Sparassis crispa]GBE79159.1 hypothetical protein SCP_0203560 [Sparassis crispa]
MLPEELWMDIFDFLQDDLSTLRACNLTCRAWVPLVRRHLFHSFAVRNNTDFAHLKSLVKTGLTPFIRNITIDAAAGAHMKFLEKPLPQLLQRLSAVDKLHLTFPAGRHMSCIRAETVQSILASFPANTVNVDGWFWRPSLQIQVLPCCFVTVHKARDRMYKLPSSPYMPSGSDHRADSEIQISELRLAGSTCAGIIQAGAVAHFLRPPFKVNVRRLEWNSRGSEACQDQLASILQRADTLQFCHIALFPSIGLKDTNYIPRAMDGVRFAHLESLHLQFNMYWLGPMYAWALHILSRVHSPHLGELKITFQGHPSTRSIPDPEMLDWGVFDAEVARIHAEVPQLFVLFMLKVSKRCMALWVRWVTEVITTRLPRARASRVRVGLAYPESHDSASTGAGEDSMIVQWLL